MEGSRRAGPVGGRGWGDGRGSSEPSRSSWSSSSLASSCSTAPLRRLRRICEMDTAEANKGQMNEHTELEQLRTRVAELEAELVEVQARADAAVAEWQDRAYWLDRLPIDLNALMRRPG